jgi:hypothetical protein
MARTILALAGLIAFPCLLSASCSAGNSDTSYGRAGSNSGGGSGGDPDASILPDAFPGGSGGSSVPFDGSNPDGTWFDGDQCVGLTVAAEPYPLDMYVMMDQSGSMSAPLGFTMKTQWVAIKDAFVNFLNASPSTGLSMGIQYFPLPLVPWDQVPTCDQQSSPNCGSGKLCLGLDNGDHCLATCTSGSCANGAECLTADSDAGSTKYCSNDSCNAQDYAQPEVEIAELPGNNGAIIASLNNHSPLTMTPTAPALDGAIQHAKQWAAAHPDRTTVVVFATDGMPTVCTEGATFPLTKVKQIAQDGVQGNPSIRTFVIGVGSMASNLNQVAASGGTDKAFLVPANGDVTVAFAAALDAIRGAMMECEFQIPQSGGPVNYEEVNVVYEAVTTDKTTLYYVADASQCDPTYGGWYYDTDPAQATPTKILLCPQNCDYIHAKGGAVHVVMGCKTVKPPK